MTTTVTVRTAVTATLSVRDWPGAVAFYKAAFGARELFVVPGGGVAQLAIGDEDSANFWVAEESTEHKNFSPESLGGCSVRMLLIVADPATIVARAVAAGATLVAPVEDNYGWRLSRIVDPAGPSLGNRPPAGVTALKSYHGHNRTGYNYDRSGCNSSHVVIAAARRSPYG
jgi:PhnB protein